MMQAYCVKCREKREMESEMEVSMKGKGGCERKALKGRCPTCGTVMFRIIA
ncbi:MAG: DUF5679 domain-containing protein [Patescibacteria group bacterium]